MSNNGFKTTAMAGEIFEALLRCRGRSAASLRFEVWIIAFPCPCLKRLNYDFGETWAIKNYNLMLIVIEMTLYQELSVQATGGFITLINCHPQSLSGLRANNHSRELILFPFFDKNVGNHFRHPLCRCLLL